MTLSKSEGRVLLYVEDDPAAPLLLEAAISESTVPGVARLVTIVTGQQAVDYLRRTAVSHDIPLPDLLLLDLHLPVQSGLSVLQELRTIDVLIALPVLIFSSCATIRERDQAYALGALDVIDKPTDLDGFVRAANSICAHLMA